eukprot:763234-Hanusia_phi.AAC.1
MILPLVQSTNEIQQIQPKTFYNPYISVLANRTAWSCLFLPHPRSLPVFWTPPYQVRYSYPPFQPRPQKRSKLFQALIGEVLDDSPRRTVSALRQRDSEGQKGTVSDTGPTVLNPNSDSTLNHGCSTTRVTNLNNCCSVTDPTRRLCRSPRPGG